MSSPPSPYSVREVAAVLHIHEDTVYAQIRSGAITAVKVGRAWRIPAGEVARLTGETIEVAS